MNLTMWNFADNPKFRSNKLKFSRVLILKLANHQLDFHRILHAGGMESPAEVGLCFSAPSTSFQSCDVPECQELVFCAFSLFF